MKALIQATRIIELSVAEFPVHSDLQWVDVADDTTTQDTYVNDAVVKYTEPSLTWAAIRQQRNILLAASDYTQVADAPGDTSAWATYRQALRDIPSQSDVDNITWPQEPG